MYTLTRKLSVVCLTVVLSFLVYGCGGSSKQATITDVSADMVTAGLTPDSGTYTIQPGGTATAGDVTFACPEEGSSCEVTVADDGTVTSAGGMATAMTSDSAAARLAALDELDTANSNLMTVQGELDTANSNLMTVQGELDTANSNLMTVQGELDTANSNLMTVQGELDTANSNLDTANSNLMTANSNLMTAQGELDTANSNLMTAQGELDTANSNLMTVQGELDTANSNLMTAQGELDTANSNLMTVQGELDTANTNLMTARGELDTANTNLDTANSNLMTVQGELATANSNLMTVRGELDAAKTALTKAETERDAANKTALAAVARAALLEMVNPFLVDSADGYGRVTPGVYEIASGGTNTEPGDDITFTCPADGPLCVVIVAVAEDGRPSYTSLGGAATGTNSVSATATIAARALHSPAVGMVEDEDHVAAGVILNTAGVNVPDTAVTRNTDGSETTITLTHDTGDATAIAVKYTSKAVDTGHKIDGWSGQTLKRSDDTDLPTPQEATVYTNIDPATKQKLKLGDGDEVAVTVPNATNVFVLDSGEDDDETINKDESSFRVAYNGVPGTFTCVGDACADINTDTDDNTGQRVIDGTQTAFVMDGWTFESDDYVEAVATQDADYMYFGYWLQSPNPDPDPDVDTSVYEFATFFGGPVGDDDTAVKFTVPTELSGRERDDEALTATYKGGAAGRYVTRKLRIKDQGVDPQSPGYTGRFTARATLTAHFGEHKDFDAGDNAVKQPETHNTIGGTITDFRDGATDLGFEITLKRADINANDGAATSEVSGVAMAKFSETATSTAAADNAGAWSGDFYGPVAVTNDEATDDMPEEDASTKLPSGVAGQFNASSPYTSVVGVFGAEKQ